MFPHDYVLAAVLLSQPAEAPVLPESRAAMAALAELAVVQQGWWKAENLSAGCADPELALRRLRDQQGEWWERNGRGKDATPLPWLDQLQREWWEKEGLAGGKPTADPAAALARLEKVNRQWWSVAKTAEAFPLLRERLQALAVEWELLDPREVRYVLSRPEDFEADLNLLRRRRLELADAPPASDSLRFPDRTTINDLLAFNRAYRQHLDVRQPGEPSRWWQLRVVLQETDQLYQIWDTIRDARCEYYYVTVRRLALKRLRDLLGEEAYYSGQLPPHVPAWRFQPFH